MSARCRRRPDCRLCHGTTLEPVLELAPTPPANAFQSPDDAPEQELFPLTVFLCRGCGHCQLSDVVDPSLLFRDYVYVSGTSPVFRDHLARQAAFLIERLPLEPGARVVEVGSNDGTLLRFFAESGHAVLGVDPARNVAARANDGGIETLPEFFDLELARELREMRGPASLVVANNVLAHVDDLDGVFGGARHLLSDDGALCFEVSYLVDVLGKTLFDTVYHEHLAYHSVTPLVPFLARHDLELVAAQRVPTQGGSLRVLARPHGVEPPEASVAKLISLEAEQRVHEPATFGELGRRIDRVGSDLRELLSRLRSEGRRVAGFGAPAKCTTLLHHFAIGSDLVDFIVDDNPLKQGLLTPGTAIPVLPPEALYERRPDVVVVFAWNFADSIMTSHRRFLEEGGRFVVPLPDVKVHALAAEQGG